MNPVYDGELESPNPSNEGPSKPSIWFMTLD